MRMKDHPGKCPGWGKKSLAGKDLALSDNGIVPEEMTIGIHGTRKMTMPAFFDRVHLTITLRANVDEALVSTIINQTLERLCPIAAMFAEVGNVTAEHRIIRTRRE